jgi:hypothetical protein
MKHHGLDLTTGTRENPETYVKKPLLSRVCNKCVGMGIRSEPQTRIDTLLIQIKKLAHPCSFAQMHHERENPCHRK